MKNLLPKEIVLENPANYNDIKIKQHLYSLMLMYGYKTLAAEPRLLHGVVKPGEHTEILSDILIYFDDINTNNIEQQSFLKLIMLGMFEAGFFG